jgi:predicted DNA-binding transcriptional regulator AlpA
MTTRLLHEGEVAERLGVATATLRQWRWAGKPPAYVKLSGGAVRYREEDIAAFIQAGLRNAAKAA